MTIQTAVLIETLTALGAGVFGHRLYVNDDVRLAVAGRVPVSPLGRVSIDFSGMRQGEILTVPWIRDRVHQAIKEVKV